MTVNKTRFFAPAALAGLLVAGGLLPQATHPVSHAAQLSGPVKGGTVIDGLYEEPDKLIPNTSTETFGNNVMQTVFAPLFYSDGNGVLHPGLAADIPTVGNGEVSKDAKTWTFKLRPGLKWSDGAPLDARDVDYSWRTWTNKDLIVVNTAGIDLIQTADISADNLSITFHLKAPFAPFISLWTDLQEPLPAHILSKMTPKALNTSGFIFKPTVFSGPFMITDRKAGDHITEVRNPNYYQAGKPYLDKLIFRIIPDQVALTNALRAHEIDAAWFLDVSQTNTLKSLSGYTYVAAASKNANTEYVLLNLKNPALADVRVRQALTYGLDRPTEIKDVRFGAASPAASDISAAYFSYDPSIQAYPYDPKKAAQLLDAAGWKLGSDNLRHKNGQMLSLRYSTTARNNWRAQDELIALQDFQQLGIQLRIINYPASTYFGKVLPSGDFDLAEFENGYPYDPDTLIHSTWGGDQLPPQGQNYGHYVSKQYDSLIQQEESIADQNQRKAIFQKMQIVMNHDAPAIWLYHAPDIAEHRNTLHNYAPGPFSSETWNTFDWYKS